jgi:VCBS repeat protein
VTPPFTLTRDPGINGMLVADLNGDSLLDLVIGSETFGSYVVPGNGDGTFGTATHLDGLGSFPVAVGDFNADGVADIVTDGLGQEIFIGLGNSNGTFQVISLRGGIPALAGDFNNDGALDVASSGFLLPNNSYDVQLQGSFQDFGLGESISSLTISAGQNTQLTLYVSPVGGFAQGVNLSCAGAPAGVSCTLSPSSVTLNGAPTQQVQVAVNLSASGSAAGVTQSPFDSPLEKVGVFLAFATLLMCVAFGRAVGVEPTSRHRPLAVCVLTFSCLLFLGMSMVACGGGGGGSNGNSLTPGTYTVTLNGTSSSGLKMINHSVSFGLTVQ